MQIFRSACPYDCPDTCGLLIHVDEGKAVKVEGDPEHPFTRGTLCPKMNHYERTVHSSRRIETPLLRTGPKGSGEFTAISWDEAIAHIQSKWQSIIAQYGAEAILPYSYAGSMGQIQRNAGHPFFYSLGASQLERTICSPAKGVGYSAVMGSTMAPHPSEVQDSDFIILWGIHALATSIHSLHDIKIAKERGAKVWLIDTYQTGTAQVADKTIVIRPGTDGALALGIMHVIARDNLIDRDFINTFVLGYEELAARILPDYSPETVSQITGIAASVIEELASFYATARAPFITLGSGMSRYGNGAMTIRTITCLPALVGAWAKKGGGLLASISTGSAFDSSRVTREDFMERPTRSINMNQIGEALNELSDPPIKSLYVYVSNPAIVAPDQNRVLQGLARDDLFTVVHERFMTDTALYADIVLPATTSLEHSDLYRAYGHYCMQRCQPVIEPVGQAKSNWDVFCLLAAAMGIDKPFFKQSADELLDSILANPSPWLANAPVDKLNALLPMELPLPKGYKTKFHTPSGKIEILNTREKENLPRYTQPYGDAADFWLINSPDIRLLNSSFNERADLTQSNKMLLQMNAADAGKLDLQDGQLVIAYNERGQAAYQLKITDKVPAGVVVAEGVWWLAHTVSRRSSNALTSQRLTDRGRGSTFYDVKVNVRASGERTDQC